MTFERDLAGRPEQELDGFAPSPPAMSDDDEGEGADLDESDVCELCGASEEEDGEELLHCEECGRLHCSGCREMGDDGAPYCVECYEELSEE